LSVIHTKDSLIKNTMFHNAGKMEVGIGGGREAEFDVSLTEARRTRRGGRKEKGDWHCLGGGRKRGRGDRRREKR
jgi:hypothetical protein